MSAELIEATLLRPWPKQAGKQIQTERGAVTYSKRPPESQNFVPAGHWIGILLAPARRVQLKFGTERSQLCDGYPGMIAVCPAGMQVNASWNSQLENVLVAICSTYLAELSFKVFNHADLEIRPTHLLADPTAFQLAKIIRAEMNNRSHGKEVYLDTLTKAIGVHIVRNYSNVKKPLVSGRARLSKVAAQRAEEYINANFMRKITIAHIADVCGLSQAHFAEAFAGTFGLPPYRFLLEKRLQYAVNLIREGKMPLKEIAVHCGFSSQSHLTITMKAQWGKTPSQLRF